MHRSSIVALLVLICSAAAISRAARRLVRRGHRGLRRERRGAIPTCRGTTRTSTRRARRSSSPRSSRDDASRTSRRRNWRRRSRKRQEDTLARAKFFGGDPEGKIGNSAEFRDIYEITKGSRPWFVVDPQDGKIPPILPERAHAHRRAPRTGSFGNGPFNSHEDFSLWDRCITRGLPGSMLPGQYGNSYQIVQGPGFVAIRYEMVHDTRVIPLDSRPNASARAIRSDMGDARGHWEGNTLVVETTNFKARSAYRNANAETLKLVERFTRTAADKVEWTVTVDDPSTWSRPWTFAIPLTMNDQEAIFEYACHEGNQAIKNILSAARAAERSRGDACRSYFTYFFTPRGPTSAP